MIENTVPWPDGKRCAVAFTFDMDADSLIHLEHPQTGYRRVSAISMLRYGPEVAVKRILQSYREFDIQQTFFVPAWCIEQYTETVTAMVDGGHEVAHHGYIHENPNTLSPEKELYWLRRGIEIIINVTGQRPRGWRAPLYNFSDASIDFLIDEGFSYDASLMGDDIPYLLSTDKGRVLELPSYWGMDDWPQFVHSIDLGYTMPLQSPSRGMDVFKEEFDAMYKYGGLWVTVWHPFASGRLARWEKVVELIDYMKGKGDVWFARMEDIAAHVYQCIEDGRYVPRVDKLPYYMGPVKF